MAEPIAKKSLGQHWLHDPDSLQAMVDAAEVQPEDTVLEIGPGLGTLTQLLVVSAKQVIAVEFDEKLAHDLPKRVKADNLEIVSQDILSFDLTTVPTPYKLVANIPYYLTSNLIRVISETSNPPQAAAILIQKEVAERAAAEPGEMSLLSITAQFYWETQLGAEVPAELFTPAPKVDSQILILKHRQKPLFPDVDPKDFFRVIKSGFAQKRKTLLNSLSSGLHIDKQDVKDICQAAEIDPSRRPQTLSLTEWYNLYLVISSAHA
jgi:16S rRNA (adenine1518-N6/adenine1519-N6)-dimethyltransferase